MEERIKGECFREEVKFVSLRCNGINRRGRAVVLAVFGGDERDLVKIYCTVIKQTSFLPTHLRNLKV